MGGPRTSAVAGQSWLPISHPKPILRARDLVKVYRRGASEVRAVDGITLDIGAGEFMAIMGRSGSGKTTLLDLLGCLLRPTSGEVLVDGRTVGGASDGELADLRRRRIGFVFQEFNLIPTLNAVENVMLPLRYGPRRPDGRQRAAGLLDLVGLGDRLQHRPSELSGGEQQRVAIARALVNDPAVLLADEPTGELDSATSAALLAMLRRLNAEKGVTVVIVTHDAGVAGSTDRVVRLRDGRVLADVRRGERGWREALGPAAVGDGAGGGEQRVFARLGAMLDRVRAGGGGR